MEPAAFRLCGCANPQLLLSDDSDVNIRNVLLFVGLLSIMFVRYDWVPFVNLVEADTTKLMFESLVGSKGAIGIRAKIGNETVCFINSHLPAHLADHKERDKVTATYEHC